MYTFVNPQITQLLGYIPAEMNSGWDGVLRISVKHKIDVI